MQDGYFPEGYGRLPREEEVPTPQANEVVVFPEFFNAGLPFPYQTVIAKILSKYRIQLHQQAPSSIVQLCKFVWAVKSYGGEPRENCFSNIIKLTTNQRR